MFVSPLVALLSLLLVLVMASFLPDGFAGRDQATAQAASLDAEARREALDLVEAHQRAVDWLRVQPGGYSGPIDLAALPVPVPAGGVSSWAFAGGQVCTWQSAAVPGAPGQQVALAANVLLGGGALYVGFARNGVYTNVAFPQGPVATPCLAAAGVPDDGVARALRYSRI